MIHTLKGADVLTELLARQHVLRGHVQTTPRAAVRIGGDQNGAGVQAALQRRRVADLHRHGVLEDDRVDTSGHVDHLQTGDRHARGAGFDQPQAWSAIVDRGNDEGVGDRGIGDERLAAAELAVCDPSREAAWIPFAVGLADGNGEDGFAGGHAR